MPTLRKNLCWIFAIEAFVCLQLALSSIPRTIHRPYAFFSLRNLLVPALFTALAVVFGKAWWTVWKERPSARVWGIAASLMWTLIFFSQFIIPLRPVWDKHVGALFIGGVGLVAFLWYGKERVPKTFFEWLYERDAPRDLFNKH